MPPVRSSSHAPVRASRLALAYLVFVVLTWLLGEWVAEDTLITLILAYAPPLIWLLPAVVVWCWVLFRKRKIGIALVATLLAGWNADLFHWRTWSDGDLRVLTYNTLGGRTTTPLELARFLKETGADIILLQETNYTRPEFREQLERAMPEYIATHAAEVSTLTRLSVQPSEIFSLPQNTREVLLTPIVWKGQEIHVINVHLGTVMLSPLLQGNWAEVQRSRDARNAQVDVLRNIALQTSGIKLLAGDLNTPPRGKIYRRLQNMYGKDAHDVSGRGMGWTYPSLGIRIDHQLTRDLLPVRTQVLSGIGSDHLAVLVDYKVKH